MQEPTRKCRVKYPQETLKLPSKETANMNVKAQPFKAAVAWKVQSASKQQAERHPNCGFIHMHLFAWQ